MMGAWSYLRQFMYTKWLIVVDDDIDARDWKDVMWADLYTDGPGARHHPPRKHPDRLSRLRLAGLSGLGSKIGLDATNKWPPETKREWGEKLYMEKDVIDRIDRIWGDLGLPGSGKSIWS